MSREEAERMAAEFNSRLHELISKDPRLTPESPEVKSLIKEFSDKGMRIQIVTENDIMKATMNMMEMLNQMGIAMPNDDIHASQQTESLEKNLDPCKFHKKGLDDCNRSSEITKAEIDNLAIDLNTKSDEEIWKMFS